MPTKNICNSKQIESLQERRAQDTTSGLNRSWPRTIPTHPRDRPGRFLDAGTRPSYAGGARCHLRILVHGPLRSYAY